MSIEPLRRTAPTLRGAQPRAGVRAPLASVDRAAGAPVQRRAVGQMCVVVSDLADGDGQVLVRNLRRRGSGRVILLARRASRRELVGLLAGGLRGAVASEAPTSLAQAPAPVPFVRDRPELTARELGVLKLVADGCSNRRIGEQLGLSALTVKSHLARISRKLGTGDRAALVAISIRTGLLD